MISPNDFVKTLKTQGFQRFTGVPCSFFQAAIHCVLDSDELEYTMVPNEGSALALASGAYLAGKPTVLLIQNSGFGNLMNPLTSLNMIYEIPVLVFMSGRAWGVKDEPQHEVIGRTMGPVLEALGIRFEEMPDEIGAFKKSVEKARLTLESEKKPYFFFVKKDILDDYVPERSEAVLFPLKRIEAIEILAGCLTDKMYVVATTGKPSRELFSVCDRAQNFYMQGSMGHAPSIGLGAAMAHPEKKVVVLDGDGALLMHLGILSTIGHYRPKNLYHVVLDNEAYETTGNQNTTSSTTNFETMAIAAGYRGAKTVSGREELRKAVKEMLDGPGPFVLRVKINRTPTGNISRISSKHSSSQIARTFKKSFF
jgi:phosphonopyruvate decarboxylase